MENMVSSAKQWVEGRIKTEEISAYLKNGGQDFIDEKRIESILEKNKQPDNETISSILKKSLEIKTLTLEETAMLLHVKDKDVLEQMKATALKVKQKVYDNRIVTFAPLYMGNRCINNCSYCGFKCTNTEAKRRVLNADEVREQVEVLAGEIGHKRLIVVYGEHPETDVDYMVDSIRTIYEVDVKTKKGSGRIRRVNVNAPPMSIEELRKLRDVGIGTYQVFQETYHHGAYRKAHPADTVKGSYPWRLYSMHRAFEAGIDDVGIGALFGLYDWRFEVMGLIAHAHELENRFGIGPHTISFPRLEPASDSPVTTDSPYLVNDEEFKHLMLVIRLSVPYAGMIITARENADMRKVAFQYGCTQTDASTCIGIGGYTCRDAEQEENKQQFHLGDTRSLEDIIREYASMGHITSFCTAGYRCGRTGECIMELLKTGQEGVFCKLNAIITFREWLDDFASEDTKAEGEQIIKKEIKEVKERFPEMYPSLMEKYELTKKGARDIYF